ncbi:hypothetical protein QYM36_018849 [Artemia franciscana]|uniref:Uncharacterized protein n=1 Tax=Artemia franciscana TaxID=6661 RepID=A0AA88KU78_ARTSF|nr:hypothetical protein QYM36_018849 [Artemia franciscana]
MNQKTTNEEKGQIVICQNNSKVQHTLKVILEEIEQSSLPVEKTWRLRGIVKRLDKLSDEAIMAINLPIRIPVVYELDDNLKPIKLLAVMDVTRRIPVKPQDVKNDHGQICELNLTKMIELQ